MKFGWSINFLSSFTANCPDWAVIVLQFSGPHFNDALMHNAATALGDASHNCFEAFALLQYSTPFLTGLWWSTVSSRRVECGTVLKVPEVKLGELNLGVAHCWGWRRKVELSVAQFCSWRSWVKLGAAQCWRWRRKGTAANSSSGAMVTSSAVGEGKRKRKRKVWKRKRKTN